MNSNKISSTLVLNTLCALETLASQTKKLTLAWVKAHVGSPGNELADSVAKAGAEDNTMSVDNTPLFKIYSRDLSRDAIRANGRLNGRRMTDLNTQNCFILSLTN